MKLFEVGKSYYCSSLGDHNCIWEYTVTKRTPKTITIKGLDGADGSGLKRISAYNGYETVSPLGSYSMSPILTADKECEPFDEDSDPVVRLLKKAVAVKHAEFLELDKIEIVHVKEEEDVNEFTILESVGSAVNRLGWVCPVNSDGTIDESSPVHVDDCTKEWFQKMTVRDAGKLLEWTEEQK
jgi:hypothetical protein